ncbi:LamB/YcsF family protein [Rhodococcus wratislaviensis]|uniref:LamB/YcsF family protein n=1 Tax=Rhodococcus wratislaviensis TaxID=44752 RepID=UPI0036592ED9
MGPRTVSINTDIGEGFGVWGVGDEAPLMDQVTAANIACGFHAGDPDILRRTCEMAAARGVSVGAQVSYRDLVGFGRRFIDVPTLTLVNDIVYQIGALQAFARIAGTFVSYVKAHGALYNTAARHQGQASAIVEAIGLLDAGLPVLCQYDTVLWKTALDAGLTPHAEVFIDRSYTDDGLLVPRSHPDALIVDPSEAATRAVHMVETGSVASVAARSVTVVPDDAATIAMCIHSDTPGAVDIARQTRSMLEQNGQTLVPIGGGRHG